MVGCSGLFVLCVFACYACFACFECVSFVVVWFCAGVLMLVLCVLFVFGSVFDCFVCVFVFAVVV